MTSSVPVPTRQFVQKYVNTFFENQKSNLIDSVTTNVQADYNANLANAVAAAVTTGIYPQLISIVQGLVGDLVSKVDSSNGVLYGNVVLDGTIEGVTPAMIGLGNVDNTADLDKPISTATQTALNTKAAITYVDTAISNLIDSAPGTLNTLNEIATLLQSTESFVDSLNTTLGTKAPSANPTFTGTPAGPTASVGTNTTQLSTTAFVQNELSDVRTRLTAAEVDVDDLQSRMSVVEPIVSSHTSSLTSLTSTSTSHGTTLASHASSLTSLGNRVTDAEGEILSLEASSTSVSGYVSTLQTDVSALQTTVGGHTTSLSSLNTTVSGHTTSLSTLSTGLSTLQTNSASYMTETDGRLSSIDSSISSLTSSVNAKASIASPSFTGTPTVPTPIDTSVNQATNVQYVLNAITSALSSLDLSSLNLSIYALLASPSFTGTPTVPTATTSTSTTQVASTAFVQNVVNDRLTNPTLTGTVTIPTPAAESDTTVATTTAWVRNFALGLASLVSPSFTGFPTAPTPATNSNSTLLATTAFVQNVCSQLGISNITGLQTALDGKQAILTNVGMNGANVEVSTGLTVVDSNITCTSGVSGKGKVIATAVTLNGNDLQGLLDGKQATIADGGLTIAKTSGLQSALDAKQNLITDGSLSNSVISGLPAIYTKLGDWNYDAMAQRSYISHNFNIGGENVVDGNIICTTAGGGNISCLTATLNGSDLATLLAGKQATITDGSLTIARTNGLQTALNGKQATIADGDLTIAKTSGLQTALDAKAPLSNPVFTGLVTLDHVEEKICTNSVYSTTMGTNSITVDYTNLNGLVYIIPGYATNFSCTITSVPTTQYRNHTFVLLIDTSTYKVYCNSLILNGTSYTPVVVGGLANVSINSSATYVMQTISISTINSSSPYFKVCSTIGSLF